MSTSLWAIILVTGIFTGFLMGYSVPPMVEVGMIGSGSEAKIGIDGEIGEDMEEYYRSLSLEADEGQSQ